MRWWLPARAPLPCDLYSLVDDTVVLFRRDGELPPESTVCVRAERNLPLVTIDPKQIRQVLWNLLRNAAEAMPSCGRIDVEMELAENGDALTLSVTDDGVGPAKGPGSGIQGMRERVAAAGGIVTFGSGANGGTELRIDMPFGGSSS